MSFSIRFYAGTGGEEILFIKSLVRPLDYFAILFFNLCALRDYSVKFNAKFFILATPTQPRMIVRGRMASALISLERMPNRVLRATKSFSRPVNSPGRGGKILPDGSSIRVSPT